MHKQIFVNLPVHDLKRSMTFFKELGLSFNAQFTNDDAACFVIGENIFAMLLVEPFFQTFTEKPIVDAHKGTEALVCLSCESRAEVDNLVQRAGAARGAGSRLHVRARLRGSRRASLGTGVHERGSPVNRPATRADGAHDEAAKVIASVARVVHDVPLAEELAQGRVRRSARALGRAGRARQAGRERGS